MLELRRLVSLDGCACVLRDDFLRMCNRLWFSLMLQLLGPGIDMV